MRHLKKMGNKGLTTVEVLVTFILLAIVTVSLYSTVSSYRNKQALESYKEKIYTYKNLVTREIENDLIKHQLKGVDEKGENKYELALGNGVVKIIEITDNSIKYGSEGDIIEYPFPDLGTYEDVDGKKTVLTCDSVKILTEAELFSISFSFNHVDFGTRYGINIVCPIGEIPYGKGGDGTSLNQKRINITNNQNVNISGTVEVGNKITLSTNNSSSVITKILVKQDGKESEIVGNSFEVTDSSGNIDVTICEIKDNVALESEHNPYSNNLDNVVIGERTFEGAKSLKIEMDYQTESTSYDWIYLYDSNGIVGSKIGGKTRKTETFTVPGNYVKIVFRTDGSGNTYYGFRAVITAVYK